MAQSLQKSSTEKQRWWKEAVVYQVSLPLQKRCTSMRLMQSDLPSIFSEHWCRLKTGMGRCQGYHFEARLFEASGRQVISVVPYEDHANME